MKTVLAVVLGMLCAFGSFAQRRQDEFVMWPVDVNTEKIVFTESVYIPPYDAATLFANAKRFASNTFKGARDTIIANDTTKTLTCKSSFYIPVEELGDRGKGFISFTFSVWCHKNAYRYVLTDLQHAPINRDGVVGGPLENEKALSGAVLFPRHYWNAQKAKCYYRIQTTIEQFKEAMSRPAEG